MSQGGQSSSSRSVEGSPRSSPRLTGRKPSARPTGSPRQGGAEAPFPAAFSISVPSSSGSSGEVARPSPGLDDLHPAQAGLFQAHADAAKLEIALQSVRELDMAQSARITGLGRALEASLEVQQAQGEAINRLIGSVDELLVVPALAEKLEAALAKLDKLDKLDRLDGLDRLAATPRQATREVALQTEGEATLALPRPSRQSGAHARQSRRSACVGSDDFPGTRASRIADRIACDSVESTAAESAAESEEVMCIDQLAEAEKKSAQSAASDKHYRQVGIQMRNETQEKLERAQSRPKAMVHLHEPDWVKRLGKATWFKLFCTFVVLASVGLVGLEANVTVDHALSSTLCGEMHGPNPGDLNLSFFMVMEWIVIAWMTFELYINVRTAGGWIGVEGYGWNLFDLTILMTSLVQILSQAMAISAFESMKLNRGMKFVRLLRLAKVMKTLRVVRLLHGVRRMILSMLGSLSSLFWALFLMFFIMFLVSVLMMQGVEIYFESMNEGLDLARCDAWESSMATNDTLPMNMVPDDFTEAQSVQKFYGSVLTTMLTLFGSISGGSEWPVVANPVGQISWLFIVLWFLFICFMIFGVLNVLTGIFVEAAMEAAQNDRVSIVSKERQEMERAEKVLKNSFRAIDSDNSGVLTKEEFHVLLDDEEVAAMMVHIGLDTSDASSLFGLLDEDRSGEISFEEFLQGCLTLKGVARKIDLIALMYQNRRIAKTLVALMDQVDDMWGDFSERHPGSTERQVLEGSGSFGLSGMGSSGRGDSAARVLREVDVEFDASI